MGTPNEGGGKNVSIIIKNAYIVTMDAARRCIKNGVVVIDGEKIAEVGNESLLSKYTAAKTIDAGGKYVFPGLISTHTHSFQVLTRGLGRDRELFDWLDSSVRRALHSYTDEYIYYGALICAMESLRSGTTTTMDYMYCQSKEGGFSDQAIEAMSKAGIRTVYGRGRADTSQFPDEFRCNHIDSEQDYIDDVKRLHAKYRNNDMISIALAPGLISDLSEDGLIETGKLARQDGLTVTMHTLETEYDNEYCMNKNGMNVMPYLDKTGILGPNFVAVHCVDMHDEDFEIFKERDIKVSHCPLSNMILASGIAPVKRMLDEGITVSLGVDGASSNDTQSMIECVRMSSLLQKAKTRDPKAVPASAALEMGTVMGAKALGFEDRIGSIEAGKKADLFIFDPDRLHTTPTHDPVCALVYNGSSENIDTVIVNGKSIIENCRFTDLDEEMIMAKARTCGKELAKKAGLFSTQWGRPIDL